jgi:hypothetical protein
MFWPPHPMYVLELVITDATPTLGFAPEVSFKNAL